MDNKNLIPAYIDDKNITTDWIEEIFDGQCATSNGKIYLGFVKNRPIRCDIIGYQLWWRFLNNSASDCAPAMHELIERLKAKDDLDEEHRIYTQYRRSDSKTTLWQSFYWNNND